MRDREPFEIISYKSFKARRTITSSSVRCTKVVLKKFCIFLALTLVTDLLRIISFSGKKIRCWAFQSAERYLTNRKYFMSSETFIKIKNNACTLKSNNSQFINIGMIQALKRIILFCYFDQRSNTMLITDIP